MSESFDAVVIGAGPAGEVMVSRLHAAGKRVTVVEAELIGGECGYWACIPSKTLLRAPEARIEADRAELNWPALRDYRDYMIRYLDDSGQVRSYTNQGVTVSKASARLSGPGTVEAGWSDAERRAHGHRHRQHPADPADRGPGRRPGLDQP